MKEKILALLMAAEDYVSGQELCEKFGVSRTAVWKAVNQLKKEGYGIEAVTNRGYRLVYFPDRLSEQEMQSLRKTKWVGNSICYYDEIDSTNTEAKRLAESGAPHGTLVVADCQTTGRGRRGRGFVSKKGSGLFMTLVLRPEILPGNASMLTLVAAMSVHAGIKKITGLDGGIKWPNDIVLNRRKVCGILTEMSTQLDYINYIVVGIGINVQNDSFPEEIRETATSLFLETGQTFRRAELLEAVLEAFEHYYDLFVQTEDLSGMVGEYNELLINRGQQVRVLDPLEPFEGQAAGINERGELLVDTPGGRKAVSSGEVSVRGVYGYV